MEFFLFFLRQFSQLHALLEPPRSLIFEEVPQSYLQSDAPDLILDILSKIKIFWINLEIQNKFFWLSLQSKQKGDKPKARLNRLKEKHSLSGLWVPRNFCKEIVVLGNKQELKVGAQQKTLL